MLIGGFCGRLWAEFNVLWTVPPDVLYDDLISSSGLDDLLKVHCCLHEYQPTCEHCERGDDQEHQDVVLNLINFCD